MPEPVVTYHLDVLSRFLQEPTASQVLPGPGLERAPDGDRSVGRHLRLQLSRQDSKRKRVGKLQVSEVEYDRVRRAVALRYQGGDKGGYSRLIQLTATRNVCRHLPSRQSTGAPDTVEHQMSFALKLRPKQPSVHQRHIHRVASNSVGR